MMPTAKPRIAVTLNQTTFDVIARMAQLQGCSRGPVVAELLETVAPALARTVALLEAAADAPQQVRDGLLAAVQGTHNELAGISGDALRQLDFLLGEFDQAGINPHVVTRGSGSDTTRGSAPVGSPSKPATTRPVAKKPSSKRTGVKDAGKNRPI